MKKSINKLKPIFTIFDIVVILLIAGIAFFSIFSYYNIKVEKTEDYLRYFFLALKITYYLGMIAFVHMFLSLVYLITKKIKGENEI